MGEKSAVRRVADFGDVVLERFIGFFHSKETLSLGLISLLILHFFTDLIVFIVPSLVSLKESFYSAALSEMGNATVYSLFLRNISGLDFYTSLNVFLAYFANIVFVVSIFTVPLLLLKTIYQKISKH